ncbi:hypothetical protein LTR78_002843 [Recurvomyces mirabilis]|uniref:Cullin family profile domain-containing protein n=1 Tax=Recurvomyces mirabilis TaxID=574656 RepID=A0AAE1C462_9PEZI|nr:hypothetical protein LTR78_002843 [Recurvomyces mirabilis]KAK5159424.1 hypothetical protein LTS14_002566 [Recurvomyces mirabilis]
MAAAALASVFPATSFTTPTPETTPNIGILASPGQAFGGPTDFLDDAVALNRAWSVATRYLSLGNFENQQSSTEILQAIDLLSKNVCRRAELQAWYSNEIATHFRLNVDLSTWTQAVSLSNALHVLQDSVRQLMNAHAFYAGRPNAISAQWLTDAASNKFRQLVKRTIPADRLHATLASAFYERMTTTLAGYESYERCQNTGSCLCELSLDGIPIDDLSRVGLGGRYAERAFALSVHRLLNRARTLQVLTSRDGSSQAELDASFLESMAVSALGRLRVASLFDYVKSWPASQGAFYDIQQHLASTQTLHDKAHLCDSFIRQISSRLLHAGASTTDVLSIYISVIHAFRLLDAKGVMLEKVAHPVRHYLRGRDDTVAVIAASFLADVNVEGTIAGPDAERGCAAITFEVANSGLAERKEQKMLNFDDMQWVPDPIDAGPDFKATKSEDVLAYVLGLFDQEEFIKEVTTVLAQHLLHSTDEEYVKETRLVELFKSRFDNSKLQAAEVMLKDVRDSVHLNRRLNTQHRRAAKPITPRDIQAAIPADGISLPDLCRTLGVVENAVQVHAALKLVASKRGNLYFAKRTRLPPRASAEPPASSDNASDFDVQVLSSFFWPQMRANDFEMPTELADQEATFNIAFARLGNQRKLHFRRALARVDVRIELEDRTVDEHDVNAWRASIIDAFTASDVDSLTVDRLLEDLQMDEELVLDALNFWTSKRVLFQRSAGEYAVLERLDMDTGGAPQVQIANEAISGLKSQDAVFKENSPMFEAFIKNMLQNSGPKEVGGMMGITGMLRMVLPTFTYGDEEVGELLAAMEGRGEVTHNADVWSSKA